jgi:hypothetical protein
MCDGAAGGTYPGSTPNGADPALILAGWPGISVIVLGILLGVNFISTGAGYMAVSNALKPHA